MRDLPTLVVLVSLWAPAAGAAEMRTWTAAAGGFSVEAEFVELKAGELVRLKTKDGRVIDVPLAQLSAADQATARQAAAGPAPIAASDVMPEKPSAQFTRALKAADRCRNPEEAIVVLKVFVDDPQSAPAEKAYAAGRIAECKDAAAKNQVRVNKKWIAKEEADAVRKKADELMRQGLALLKLKQEDAFKKKFGEAAALEPEEIRAEFLMALIYTFGRRGDKALPIFQKCLVRDPENVAVLNNVAMLAAAKREYATAFSAWRRALDFRPDQRVVHNVGRFLEQCTETTIKVPANIRDGLALPYSELTASGKFEATDGEVGWLLMLIETSDLNIDLEDDDETKQDRKSPAPEPNDDGTVIGSGTGFVVAPGYVLTNEHVAMDDAAYEIQAPDGTRHKATRVAADAKLDLALLKCEPLTAPHLVLHDSIVPRGTDVMLFGYPEMLVLGASLKATRGSISSLPDPQGLLPSSQGTSSSVSSKYLYDAVSNAGNSGGPLCDAGANVVAVHSTGYNTASRYAGGIPSTQALEFVKKALPEFMPSAPSAAKLDWPKVDERAAASTMLIWIRKKNARAETASLGGDVIELPFCLFCGGLGKLKCAHPGCVGGFINTRQGRMACPTCDGKAIYDCEDCGGVGIDVALRSVQRVLATAAAAKAAAGATSPNPSGGTPTPSTSDPSKPVVASNLQGSAKVGDPNSAGVGPMNFLGYDPASRDVPTGALDASRIPQLLADLRGSNVQIKAAAKLLSTVTPAREVQATIAGLLEQGLRHADWSVRAQCVRAYAIWNTGGRQAALERATDDESWIVRELACYAILHVGEVQSTGPLFRRLALAADAKNDNYKQYDPRRERSLAVRCLIALGPSAKTLVERFRNDAATTYEGKCAAEEVLQAYAAAG